MLPDKAGLPVFIHCLLTYIFTGSRQLPLRANQNGFRQSLYNNRLFTATLPGKLFSQLFVTSRVILPAIDQLLQALSGKDCSISYAIQNSNFLNIKTLQV
jgi:hypothetical protein